MSSQVRYKFRSQTAYDLLQFDGHGITVGEVKIMIAEKKGLGSDAVQELVLHNPTLKIDYDDDTKLLLKNTSVVVRRVPLTQRALKPLTGATPAPAAVVSTLPAALPRPDNPADVAASGGDQSGEDVAMHSDYTGPVTPADVQAFIESAAKGIHSSDQLNIQQQASGRGAGRGGGRWGGGRGRAPPNFTCSRCGGMGHFLNDCPTKDDPAFDKKYRHPAGIPVCKIQRNADGGLFLPDGEAGEMAPNLAAFQNLASMLPNAARSNATPEPEDQLADAVGAALSLAHAPVSASNPPAFSGPSTEEGMFMPSLVLPAPLPKQTTLALEHPNTAPSGLFAEDDEQQAPAPHASLALGMGAPADLSLLHPSVTKAADQAFPRALLRDTLNPSMDGVPDDLLGVGCDINTFMHLLPALEPVIPKAPIKYLVKLFASGRPLTPLEFSGLQHSIGKDISVAAVRERKHANKPVDVAVKREEKKKRRHSSRSPSPSPNTFADGNGSKVTQKRSGDSGIVRLPDPVPLEHRQRRREDIPDDRREFRNPQQVQPSQRFEPHHSDPRFEPQGQDFRGSSSLHNRYDFLHQEFRGNGGPRGSRPPDFAPHMGPFRQQPPPPARDNRLALERDTRIAQDWDNSSTATAERDNSRSLKQRETRFAERDGVRGQHTRIPSPPLTRRPSNSTINSIPKASGPSDFPHNHTSHTSVPPQLKTQHSSSSSQRIKQEPAHSEKERGRPSSNKGLPASSKRHSSPAPAQSPASSPVRSPARARPKRLPSRSPTRSRSRSPVRARGRHNGDTERWQGDAEQSAALEKLSVRVPRSVLSPGHASPAGCAVGSPTPDHVTAEAAAAAGDQWGKEEGVGASMSRWEQGDDDEQLDYDMDDEPMEDNSKDPQDNMLESRVSEQQPGPEDEVKQEASRVSPSSAKGPAVLTALKPEPSETKHEQMGSSRDGRSVSPDVKRVTDTVTDKKSSKRHKRHKEGREHKSKHRSKRHDSPSRLASQSPPPVVRDPTPEVKAPTPEPEVLPQPLPQTTQTDRPEKRRHRHKSSSSRHKSDRQDVDIKREARESDQDGRREDKGDGSSKREQRRSVPDASEERQDVGSRKEHSRSAPEVSGDREDVGSRRGERRSGSGAKEDKVKVSKADSNRSPTGSKDKHRSSSRRS